MRQPQRSVTSFSVFRTPSLVCVLIEKGKEKGAEDDAVILVSGTSVGLVGHRTMHEHGVEIALMRLILPVADAQQFTTMQFGKHALEDYGIPHLLNCELEESNHFGSGTFDADILNFVQKSLAQTKVGKVDGPRDKKPTGWRVQTVFLSTGEGIHSLVVGARAGETFLGAWSLGQLLVAPMALLALVSGSGGPGLG